MNNKELFKKRLLDFSVKIVQLSNLMPKSSVGQAITNQIIRSGTSIGANCEEAQDAVSRNDFLNKISISLKEARETKYWLEVIKNSGLMSNQILEQLAKESDEIIAILVKSVKTLKSQK